MTKDELGAKIFTTKARVKNEMVIMYRESIFEMVRVFFKKREIWNVLVYGNGVEMTRNGVEIMCSRDYAERIFGELNDERRI